MPPPSSRGGRLFVSADLVDDVCGSVFTWAEWAGAGEDVPPTALSYPWFMRSRHEWRPLLWCLDILSQRPCHHTCSRVGEYTCLCKALSSPCPWTRFSGTCWVNMSHKKHKSYCLSTCTSTPQPERGQALRSKEKATTPCTKCHLFCLRLGPGSEICSQMIIFQKYFQSILKLSQFNVIWESLLLIVTGSLFGLDVSREKRRKQKQRTKGESKNVPCLCHLCTQETSAPLT